MSDEIKQKIVELVVERDLSSIELISDMLEIDEDVTLAAIQELLSEGQLKGNLTDDNTRFFKAEIDLSDKPVIPRESEEPDFLRFNPRPGRITASIGAVILIAGIVGYLLYQDDIALSSVFAIIMFIGVSITSCGCYYLGTRKTP
ncbi:MAG: hypothetical protein JSW61_06230 [Candidatus Thorarchaeota archaeon]|nr:MAG: hypothetical protein JSW61_06230 [Candidatus Thorarchaeota archaeon]